VFSVFSVVSRRRSRWGRGDLLMEELHIWACMGMIDGGREAVLQTRDEAFSGKVVYIRRAMFAPLDGVGKNDMMPLQEAGRGIRLRSHTLALEG